MRSESVLDAARASVDSTNKPPKPIMGRKVFKITYPITKTFIYPDDHIGNRIGNVLRVVDVTLHNPRQLRAMAILSSGIGAVKRINRDYYVVKSQSGNGEYDVKFKRGVGWTCTCPDYKKRGK